MTNKAVKVTKAAGAKVETLSQLPSAADLGADEVLIKNVAVASNPKDWKMAKWGIFEGIEGNDVAGHIAGVGSSVKSLTTGDRVIAFTRMATDDKYGAYQAYTVAPSWTTVKLANNVTFESGATVPLAAATAFVGLFDKLGLPEPTTEGGAASGAQDHVVLVWGASSSVGSYVVQLARTAGFHIIAVAGAARDAVHALGVPKEQIVDYRDSQDKVIANLKNAANGKEIKYGYDAISTPETIETVLKVLSRDSKVTTVLPTKYDDEEANKKLKSDQGVSYDRTSCGAVHNDKKDFGERWFKQVGDWLADGKFKPNNVQIVEGGLNGVPEGLRLLEENKISNKKLVGKLRLPSNSESRKAWMLISGTPFTTARISDTF